MRALVRNKRTIHYALRVGADRIVDEYGNETGETAPKYGEPVELRCNISAASGEDAVQAFGSFTAYSRSVYVADTGCPIDEDSVVWFGVTPDQPHNYIVVRKADSKNGVLYALQEVTVT